MGINKFTRYSNAKMIFVDQGAEKQWMSLSASTTPWGYNFRRRRQSGISLRTWRSFCLVCLASLFAVRVEGFTVSHAALTTTTANNISCYNLVGRRGGAAALGTAGKDEDEKKDDKQQIFNDFGEQPVGCGGELIEDLSYRVNKLRLEEANTRRFLKAKPRFLPYDECCKWVQAFGRWRSKKDW